MNLKTNKLIRLNYNAAYYLEVLQMISGLSASEIVRQLIIEVGEELENLQALTPGWNPRTGTELDGPGFLDIIRADSGPDSESLEDGLAYILHMKPRLAQACVTHSRIGRPTLVEDRI